MTITWGVFAPGSRIQHYYDITARYYFPRIITKTSGTSTPGTFIKAGSGKKLTSVKRLASEPSRTAKRFKSAAMTDYYAICPTVEKIKDMCGC